ncbi:MAG: MgtC/SapB family protein [Bacteroidaceae bacterium]|nr:MgtC/SapB family protein [Bacteroidaceae bacterium]
MITETVALTRLAVSFLLGGLIGIERYVHKHPAGVRTFMLICLGSTLATLASIWICQTNMNLINGDPGRIAAQVLTGIGFIGAGLILKNNNDISGLTTAAGIFVTAAIGIAVGVGMLLTATVVTVVVVVILFSSFLFHNSERKNKQNNKKLF